MFGGLGFPLGVTLSADGSCDCEGGLLSIQFKNICEAGTIEYTSNVNLFNIARISTESWIDLMFVELS